jgi:deoxycytidylate deaminase
MTKYKASINNSLVNVFNEYGYVMPKNIIINMTFKLDLNEIPIYYNNLPKKQKKIIDSIDTFYLQFVNNNTLYSKCKSIHIACLTYKKQHIIRTNDYNRTYHNNIHITSYHAEHSVVTCKNCKCEASLYKNSTLCVIRYNKEGMRCNSRPCNHCVYQIWKSNVKTIIYSVDNDLFNICKIK